MLKPISALFLLLHLLTLVLTRPLAPIELPSDTTSTTTTISHAHGPCALRRSYNPLTLLKRLSTASSDPPCIDTKFIFPFTTPDDGVEPWYYTMTAASIDNIDPVKGVNASGAGVVTPTVPIAPGSGGVVVGAQPTVSIAPGSGGVVVGAKPTGVETV